MPELKRQADGDITTSSNNLPKCTWVVLATTLPISLYMLFQVTLPVIFGLIKFDFGTSEMVDEMYHTFEDFQNLVHDCPPILKSMERAKLEASRSQDIILNIASPSAEKFQVLFSKGHPFIVKEVIESWPAFELFDCKYLIRHYPKAQLLDWQVGRRKMLAVIGGETYQPIDCSGGTIEHNAVGNKNILQEWLDYMEPPKFAGVKTWEIEKAKIRINAHGTGEPLHVIDQCGAILVAQLAGVIHMSVSMPWKTKSGSLDWTDPILFNLYPGQMLIIPGTTMIHREVMSQDCAVALEYKLSTGLPEKTRQTFKAFPEKERTSFFARSKVQKWDFITKCKLTSKAKRT